MLRMEDTIYSRDGKEFNEITCLTSGPWFGKFRKGLKLRMGVIKKQDFGVTSEKINGLL